MSWFDTVYWDTLLITASVISYIHRPIAATMSSRQCLLREEIWWRSVLVRQLDVIRSCKIICLIAPGVVRTCGRIKFCNYKKLRNRKHGGHALWCGVLGLRSTSRHLAATSAFPLRANSTILIWHSLMMASRKQSYRQLLLLTKPKMAVAAIVKISLTTITRSLQYIRRKFGTLTKMTSRNTLRMNFRQNTRWLRSPF